MPRHLFILFALLFCPGSKGPVARDTAGPDPVARSARPFPQHIVYQKGCILPSHISRQRMDDSVRSFYNAWKRTYIKKACNTGEYYVWFESTVSHNKQCVSEGQGYGMMIVALMAGYDTAARSIYNGLYHYYKAHPSKSDPYLMAWAQKKDCRSTDGSSATDGDMDIAYSMLLADAQWGSHDDIDYRQEATRMISSIMRQEINHKTFSILLSNSVEHDSKDYFDMRSSDFMPAHFHVFRSVSDDPRWDKVVDSNYRLFQYMQKTYSPEAGLVPDFINKIGTQTRPAHPHYLEARYDGAYNFNACRMPWRIATDYLLYGDPRAAGMVGKINRWIRATTSGDPDNISAGYSLGGNDLKNRYYEALCFIAPFAVAAMTNKENQIWLNRLWDYMVHFRASEFDYYDNSIRMICMLILSGNYWAPES
ncbi:MAG TPA: glycosyl hydrolase family 8 [Puia sp.]|nr:glycosyl hydrolase family 8 [Puia sp.]